MHLFAVHRVLPTNTGDIAAAPTLWAGAPFRGADHIDVLDGNLTRILAAAAAAPTWVIVGGGGLFGNEWFDPALARLADAVAGNDNLHAAVWGAGWNTHYDRASYPDPALLELADVVGVRDAGTMHRWVPCASALHPALETREPARHDVVVYTHQRDTELLAAAEAAGVRAMVNAGPDVGAAINFIASGRTVITGSYHGAYWAALAGRRVAVCAAFSTKFDTFPWPVPTIPTVDLRWAREAAAAAPAAYGEARDANQTFASELAARIAAS